MLEKLINEFHSPVPLTKQLIVNRRSVYLASDITENNDFLNQTNIINNPINDELINKEDETKKNISPQRKLTKRIKKKFTFSSIKENEKLTLRGF